MVYCGIYVLVLQTAFVFEVIRFLHRSTDGINPVSGGVSKGTTFIPSILSAILVMVCQRMSNLSKNCYLLMVEIPDQHSSISCPRINVGKTNHGMGNMTSSPALARAITATTNA